MYHLPHGKSWEAVRPAAILESKGFPSQAVDTGVRIDPPNNAPPAIVSRLFPWLLPSRPYYITIQYEPDRFIQNICVDYDAITVPKDLPYLYEITVALRECEYVVATDREIASLYSPNSGELNSLFDRVESLRRQKEELVARQDFEAAAKKRDEEGSVGKRIDAFLFRNAN